MATASHPFPLPLLDRRTSLLRRLGRAIDSLEARAEWRKRGFHLDPDTLFGEMYDGTAPRGSHHVRLRRVSA